MSQALAIKTVSKTAVPLSFPASSLSEKFRKKFFSTATRAEWNDWHWQMANRLQDIASLERIFTLSEDERKALLKNNGLISVAMTPYYASLVYAENKGVPTSECYAFPLRTTTIPSTTEGLPNANEQTDPLGEEPSRVTPCLVHKYPDRALFLVSNTCASYCRYCNRARMVSHNDQRVSHADWESAFSYLEAHTEIRDVLISGGDPLVLSDEKLDALLRRLRAIKHVQFIRIGSKMPIALPQRITKNLTRILKKYHPLWFSIHAIHESEITKESETALARLADAGIPMGSQTVLLKGVNDQPEIIKKLMHRLLMNRVTPYALFHLDSIQGSSRFRTPVSKGIEIIDSLRGHTSGYAVPSFIVDPPGGGGKVALAPNPIEGRDGDYLLLRNFKNETYRYYDPQ